MNRDVSPTVSSRGVCPTENDVADFAAGAIEAERRSRVERHLDVCRACRRLVAEIAASRPNVFPAVEETPPSRILASGTTLGRYVIRSFLGRGGMAAVYRAHDPVLLRDVALKVIDVGSARAGEVHRWVREARAVASLDHPNVVSLYDVGETEGMAFLAMELVVGEPLRALIGKEGVPLESRLGWLVGIARALDAAHARGLVHRDVKPENVIVGVGNACKVLDFGLARRKDGEKGSLSETITREGVVVGTPLYMAPEQLRGEALDGRTDQFAWGVVAYELLSGRRPWASKERRGIAFVSEILMKEARALDDVVPGLSPGVAAVVGRALHKEPSARFPSMSELLSALGEAREAPVRDERSDGSLATEVLSLGTSGKSDLAPMRVASGTVVFALVVAVAVAGSTIVRLRGRFAPEPSAIAKAVPTAPIAALSSPPALSSALVPSDAPPLPSGALGGEPPPLLRPLVHALPKPTPHREVALATPASPLRPNPPPPVASGANGAPILEPE